MSQLVSCSDNILIHEYDDPIQKLKIKNPHLYGKINHVTWSHNNHVLASAGDDGRVVLMKSDNGVEINRFEITKGFGLNSLWFSNTSQYLIGGSSDNTVRVFDLKSKKLTATFSDHSSEVLWVSVSKDENLKVCSSGSDGSIYVNSLDQTDNLTKLQLNDSSVRSAIFSPMKSNEIGSGHDDGLVAVWDWNKSKRHHLFNDAHTDACTGIWFSPVNHMLMGSVGLDKQVVFYDIYKNKKIVQSIQTKESLTSVTFNSDGFTIGVGTMEGNLLIMDLRYLSKNPPIILKGHEGKNITSIEFKKPYKNEKSSKSTYSRSRVNKTLKESKSVAGGNNKNGLKNIDAPNFSHETKEDLLETRSKYNEKDENSLIGDKADHGESMSVRKYSTENILEESKYSAKKYTRTDQVVGKKGKTQK